MPFRRLSLLVFVTLLGVTLIASQLTRQVVSDQERKLLRQRGREASALLTNLVNRVQTTLGSVATVVQVTNGDPAAFLETATTTRGADLMALVDAEGDGFRAQVVHGTRLAPGEGLRGPAVDALRRAQTAQGFVSTSVFQEGTQRRIGFALRVAGDQPRLVYEEVVLQPPGQQPRQQRGSEPFAELDGALYASGRPDPSQVVLASSAVTAAGRTTRLTVQAGADRWLLVVAANRPLVGSVARSVPWILLVCGLLGALLLSFLVEVLLRRREYAVALVDERTEALRERTEALAADRERLAAAEELFRDLLETAPDAVVIADGDGRIALVNRQTEALFGWTRAELVGEPVEKLLPERFRHRHHEHRSEFSADPKLRPMGAGLDLFATRADGTEFPVEVSLSPLRTDRGVLVSAAIRDVSERKLAQAELAHQALHDALTGLPNRLLLTDRLEQVLARSLRSGAGVAVLFVDLDRFKLVNDSRGHAAGDELLVTVADRLRRVVRATDTVARFGGDEFVVVCEDQMASQQASLVAERITEVLREPVLVEGQEIFLSASIGIALSDGTASPDGLLRDADAAMYRAKEQGRARSEFFDATMRTAAVVRLETQSALHRAVERDELRLHYQPVVELSSGSLAGVEALLRWEHPQHGLIQPASFIPLAEETGLIVPIGRWTIERAVAQLARWQKTQTGQPLTINVNLSARQLRQADLAASVAEIIDAHGIDPAALCLELTESTFMEDVGGHRATLSALQALGVRLAIDDFGTGYSSLTYLRRLPVDVLKIDQVFVRGLGRDRSDTAIVESVIGLAHALGLVVVAEGVETGEQAAHLRALGCDLAQGYHFARPQPAEGIDSLLRLDDAERPIPLIAKVTHLSRPPTSIGSTVVGAG